MKIRGRPPTTKTIEIRRNEEMFKNPPDFLKNEQFPNQLTATLMQSNSDVIERELIADYGNQYPHKLIFALLDPELASPLIIDEYKKRRKNLANGQINGGFKKTNPALHSAKLICEQYKDLIKRIRPNGKFSVRGVALTILKDEWNKPSIEINKPKDVRTITRWICAYQKLGNARSN